MYLAWSHDDRIVHVREGVWFLVQINQLFLEG